MGLLYLSGNREINMMVVVLVRVAVLYRENCVFVDDEDAQHCEPDRFSTKSTQEHVCLPQTTHTHTYACNDGMLVKL